MTAAVALDAVPSRADDLAVVESEGRAAILDLDHLDRPPAVLEGPAAAVWSLVDGTRNVAEIVSTLASVYDAPSGVVEADVCGFLADLVGRRFVVLPGEPAS